jgi:ElaB/YqjD/DUF883 family membrane-anchored ribosome-binding protein
MTQTIHKPYLQNPVKPLQESTQQLVEDTGTYVKHQLENGIEAADVLRNEVTERIKARPLTTILVALGIGLALGALVRR